MIRAQTGHLIPPDGTPAGPHRDALAGKNPRLNNVSPQRMILEPAEVPPQPDPSLGLIPEEGTLD